MNATKMTWVWILAFIVALSIITGLATIWNIELVSQYEKMLELSQSFGSVPRPWAKVALGSLGFIAIVFFLASFFLKFQKEMKTSSIQRDFLAKVSHELKSPISTLELTSSLLQNPQTKTEETQKLWKAHDLELSRLLNQVSLLLESARWDSGIAKPQLQSIDLNLFYNKLIDHWTKAIQPHHKIKKIGPPLSLQWTTDPELLSLILDNLIDNAHKFSPQGAQIDIHTKMSEGHKRRPFWSISVEDYGVGFNPTDSKKLFERFYSHTPEGLHKTSGTGLGLYLAKRAADALKMRLYAVSKGLGQGSYFVLESQRS